MRGRGDGKEMKDWRNAGMDGFITNKEEYFGMCLGACE